MNKNMENIFDNVYKNRIWDITTNSISGKGSEPINCQNWNSLLNNIIKEKDIKSILDFGCGDAASIMDLNLDGIIYTGVDISVIPLNKAKEKYGVGNIHPVMGDMRQGENYNPIPDTSKIEAVGFKANVSFENGLEKTKQWVKRFLEEKGELEKKND